jgi:ribonuclease PH
MHRESGFMKLLPGDKFIWTIAQATGMAEVADGCWDSAVGDTCEFFDLNYFADSRSGTLSTSSTHIAGADKVTNVSRQYTFNQSSLHYSVSMATKQVVQLTNHLTAALVRAEP